MLGTGLGAGDAMGRRRGSASPQGLPRPWEGLPCTKNCRWEERALKGCWGSWGGSDSRASSVQQVAPCPFQAGEEMEVGKGSNDISKIPAPSGHASP